MGIENVWSALYSTTDRLNTGRMVAWMRELLQCQGYGAGRAQAGDHHQHLCDQPEWLLVWSSRQEHGVITNWAELWSNTHLSVANFQEFPDVQGWHKISSPLTPSLSFFYFFHAALLWVLGAVILITHLFLTPCQCHIFYFSFHISQKQWPIDHSLSDISHFFSLLYSNSPPLLLPPWPLHLVVAQFLATRAREFWGFQPQAPRARRRRQQSLGRKIPLLWQWGFNYPLKAIIGNKNS